MITSPKIMLTTLHTKLSSLNQSLQILIQNSAPIQVVLYLAKVNVYGIKKAQPLVIKEVEHISKWRPGQDSNLRPTA